MKLLVCAVLFVAGVASASKTKRGIFGEPGGLLTPSLHTAALPSLHSSSLLAPSLHAPLSYAHAPLLSSHHSYHAPLLGSHYGGHAPLLSHHRPLLSYDSHLSHHAPLLSSYSSPYTTLHHHEHIPLGSYHHSPLLSSHHLHAPAVIKAPAILAAPLHHAPSRYAAGWW